jgi:hypothetical protein
MPCFRAPRSVDADRRWHRLVSERPAAEWLAALLFVNATKVPSSLVQSLMGGPIRLCIPTVLGQKLTEGRGEWQFLDPLRAGAPSTFSPFLPATAGGNGETIGSLTLIGGVPRRGWCGGGNCGRGTAPHSEVKAGRHDSRRSAHING